MLNKKNSWFETNIKLSTKELAFMGLLLSLYIVIKYIASIILRGPLNISIEIIFWIFNGIIFGYIKGPLFSLLCDTTILFFTTGIAFWMLEYAIIAPLISLISYLLWNFFENKQNKNILFPLIVLMLLISFSLIIFFFQLINKKFNFEGINSSADVIPELIFALIIFMCVSIVGFVLFNIVKYKKTKEIKYLKWIQSLTIIAFITIIFRWIWGPYAFIAFYKKFISTNFDESTKYLLTLSGIVMKSCLTIPVSIIIFIPMIEIIKKTKINSKVDNRYK